MLLNCIELRPCSSHVALSSLRDADGGPATEDTFEQRAVSQT